MPNIPTYKPSGLLIDIDGTLLGQDDIPSPKVKNAVSKAKKLIPLGLASGRTAEDVLEVARKLELKGLHIADNGATLINATTAKTLHEAPLPPYHARKIIQKADASGMIYFASHYSKPIKSAENLEPSRINSIAIQLEHPNQASEWQKEFATCEIQSVISIGNSGEYYINFTKTGIDKARGATLFAREYQLDINKIIAIGDGPNDIGMFKAVGFPIAMGHAPESVKAHALKSVGTIHQDGVAEAIERFVLPAFRHTNEK